MSKYPPAKVEVAILSTILKHKTYSQERNINEMIINYSIKHNASPWKATIQ